MLTALMGFGYITGFPGQSPVLPGWAFSDFVAARFNVLALVAALEYRRRTGKGQYIDAAQLESCLHLLTPVLLEYQANGKEPERLGNRST